MIKRHRIIRFMVSFILLLTSLTVFGVNQRVYDNAGLFTQSEIQELETRAAELGESLKLDLVIVTTTDTKGETSRQFADDFYDKNGFGYGQNADGALFLINMQDREVYISTTGIAIKYLTDQRIESILDRVFDYLPDGQYGKAAMAFLTQVENYVKTGIPSNQHTYDEETNRIVKEEMSLAQKLMYNLLIAIVVAAIIVVIMASLNKARNTTTKHTYLDSRSFNVFNRYDRHVNTTQTFVVIPKNPPSGGSSAGRSTIHTSSSGRSHGGGGRRF